MLWPIRNTMPSMSGYQSLTDNEMGAVEANACERQPKPRLPPAIWLEVTRHLELRDVRALVLSAPPFYLR